MSTYFESINAKIYTNHKKESYNFASHFHPKTEIAYCFSGFQDIKVGNQIFTLKKGDAAIIFPNVVHEYIEHPTDQNAYTESISIMCETNYLSGIISELTTTEPVSPYINARLISEDSVLAFNKIKNTKKEIELIGWTFIALDGLIKNLELIPLSKSNISSLAPRLISYINENFEKPLTIKYLEKELGYSSSYIAHIFYDQLKVPFRTYLGTVRSEHAANMICNTSKNLTEIAYECGYNSLNTFCRCFKKVFSQTPSQYKKSLKSQKADD